MFTFKDFQKIDTNYFTVLEQTAYNIILKSKNTGHTWALQDKSLDSTTRSLIVLHKHNDMDSFHVQPAYHPRTLLQFQKLVKKHDKYQLSKDKISKRKPSVR